VVFNVSCMAGLAGLMPLTSVVRGQEDQCLCRKTRAERLPRFSGLCKPSTSDLGTMRFGRTRVEKKKLTLVFFDFLLCGYVMAKVQSEAGWKDCPGHIYLTSLIGRCLS